jgi:hypothetical protein
MSDFSSLSDQLAAQKIRERVTAAQRTRIPGTRRPHGRHAIAARLHAWAERLDG